MGEAVDPASRATEGIDPAELMQLADYEKMEDIRARVDEIVTDKATAEALKPWYNLFCKRPLYSDEFLQVFNQPNVTLVDTQGRGVDRITAKGAVFDGVEYELDCLIYATGFTAGLPPFQAGEYEVIGRDGLNLEEQWASAMRSLHGLMTHGFPNLFVQGHTRQAALSVNVPHALGAQANHAAAVIKWCLDEGVRTVEPRLEAEDAWAATLKEKGIDRAKYDSECTPGYFNNEGQPGGGLAEMYGGGPLDYMDVLDKWRAERLKDDLETTYE